MFERCPPSWQILIFWLASADLICIWEYGWCSVTKNNFMSSHWIVWNLNCHCLILPDVLLASQFLFVSIVFILFILIFKKKILAYDFWYPSPFQVSSSLSFFSLHCSVPFQEWNRKNKEMYEVTHFSFKKKKKVFSSTLKKLFSCCRHRKKKKLYSLRLMFQYIS